MEKPKSRVHLKAFEASKGLDRGVSKFKELCWYIVKVVFFLSALPYPSAFKVALLKFFGAKIGKGVVIKPRVNIHFPWKLDMGSNIWIGEETFVLNFEGIIIGDNVCISQRAFLCGGNHDYKQPSMPYRNGKIILNNGCWVGASVFVGPGVTIGVDAVVTVGAIVIKNVEPNVVCRVYPPEFKKARWT